MFDIFGVIWQGFWHLLLNVLVAINSVVGSAGVSIIIFTILMRMLTVPFTLKALRSSKNMQAVQPLVKEVQKKYGKDRAKVQEETMKIYRDYGINPAAGCFPMLLQLPIFFGLFSALSFVLPTGGMGPGGVPINAEQQWAANQAQLPGVLWNSGWIGVGNASDFRESFTWVQNLGAPDPTWIWAILSGVFQFLQTRMSLPHRDPDSPIDPQQRMMQNLMQFMPIMIVFVSAGFPAGTVIYWAFSSLFGAVLQYFITGFGTLPDLPGFGWLPRKKIELIKPVDPSALQANAAKRKNSMFGRMMERALEAQEAQKAAQAAQNSGQTTGQETVPLQEKTPARTRKMGSTRASTRLAEANGNTPPTSPKAQAKARAIVTKALESGNGAEKPSGSGNVYASDLRRAAEENGVPAPTRLPRKRKGKK